MLLEPKGLEEKISFYNQCIKNIETQRDEELFSLSQKEGMSFFSEQYFALENSLRNKYNPRIEEFEKKRRRVLEEIQTINSRPQGSHYLRTSDLVMTQDSVDTSRWPEKPYRWMAEDLYKALDAGSNYLVALGLFCYTEYIGKSILTFKSPTKDFFKNKFNKPAFNLFLGEYMGYQDIINNSGDKIYDWFRHGLAHQYYIKGQHSGVFLHFDPPSEKELRRLGIDTNKGLVVSSGNHILLAKVYLDHFLNGINRFLEESKQLTKNINQS